MALADFFLNLRSPVYLHSRLARNLLILAPLWRIQGIWRCGGYEIRGVSIVLLTKILNNLFLYRYFNFYMYFSCWQLTCSHFKKLSFSIVCVLLTHRLATKRLAYTKGIFLMSISWIGLWVQSDISHMDNEFFQVRLGKG